MLVRDPFRMMLPHPGMVVSNPPVALMPCVMVVVVTHHGRSPIYVGGGSAIRISRTRPISVRVRPVRGMPTEKTCLERDRASHENHCLQGRENFCSSTYSWTCCSSCSSSSPEPASINDASEGGRRIARFRDSSETRVTRICRALTQNGKPQELPRAERKTARRERFYSPAGFL